MKEAVSGGTDAGREPRAEDDVPQVDVVAPLVARLNELLAGESFAEIARRTGCNAETVRRYMRGGVPSVPFVIAVARQYEVSVGWLMVGEGAAPRFGPRLVDSEERRRTRRGRRGEGRGATRGGEGERGGQGDLAAVVVKRSGKRSPLREGA